MENHTFTQKSHEVKNTFVKMFLHPDLIGDSGFIGWRLYLTKEREINELPYDEGMKAYQKRILKKAKYGIGIDSIGGAIPVNDVEQVIEGRILPPWPACSLSYLQRL
ncbi:hypothetical protein [Pontibacter flavimaris]|uniref:Uncharacterized protein n=1 Tax=Pontibacter flavimaris TaxID=1797110 RepID=A0A1Q5PB92_9BACT|nr:hypothetical protein [Pontibacter flavimaris]OKL39530.1 hypothetical protein A3841_00845 [Pontibacter flavimaris]